VASENALKRGSQDPGFTSENTSTVPAVRRGRAAGGRPARYDAVLSAYVNALSFAPLADQTRRTYASKARQYLAWLAAADLDGDPLESPDGRDWAVRDYRTHLQAVLKRKPATVNNALSAVDDLYIRRGLGPASAARVEIPPVAPRALDKRAQVRYLRAVQACSSPRDQALALVPFYAGARIAETVAIDLDDVLLSARKGVLRIYGKGERVREVPIHSELRKALTDWLHERRDWLGASDSAAVFLNQHGGRLSARGAHDVITGIAARAGLDDHVTAHVLRHSFATTLVRGGTDLVITAELLGHARLETTRIYTRPTAEDRRNAVDLLPVAEGCAACKRSARPYRGFRASMAAPRQRCPKSADAVCTKVQPLAAQMGVWAARAHRTRSR
jgi:site-specific recombinase XerD